MMLCILSAREEWGERGKEHANKKMNKQQREAVSSPLRKVHLAVGALSSSKANMSRVHSGPTSGTDLVFISLWFQWLEFISIARHTHVMRTTARVRQTPPLPHPDFKMDFPFNFFRPTVCC